MRRMLQKKHRCTDSTDEISSKLLQTRWPVDSREANNTSVAYEMRNVRVAVYCHQAAHPVDRENITDV